MAPNIFLAFVLIQAALAQPAARTPRFEVASIKPCSGGSSGKRTAGSFSPGRLVANCSTVRMLIQEAYVFWANGQTPSFNHVPVSGGPSWLDSESYSIEARSETPRGRAMMYGPMLQALLEDRFKLKIRREIRQVPVYALIVARGGPKNLRPAEPGGCTPFDFDKPPIPPPDQPCGMVWHRSDGIEAHGITMAQLCQDFTAQLDRDVIDKTGISGTFDLRVAVPPNEISRPEPDAVAMRGPSFDPAALVFAAVGRLGLKLESTKGPGEILVIDSIERPSPN